MEMSKPFIFVSCGQFTKAEKSLGTAIVKAVEAITGMTAFFAEDVHDLNGLNNNILGALRECAGLIVVLHPRGEITRPDGSSHVRASVWIEQEIAIAAYIQSGENRPLPVIAFAHESVGREGIRDLLHLNPIPFATETDVLAELPAQLKQWGTLAPIGVQVELKSEKQGFQQDHPIRKLYLSVVNDTNARISKYDGALSVPTAILKHWTTLYRGEDRQSGEPGRRVFRFSERDGNTVLLPHKTTLLYTIDYCLKCGVEAEGNEAIVTNATVQATLWIDNRTYQEEKTMMALRPAEEL